MKLFALTFLVVVNLIANQAFAGDISTQPLTRADCDKAAMAWDENANVCTANSKGEVAADEHVSSQPLTRAECDQAGVAWDDNANVCGSGSEEAETTPELEVPDTSSQPLTRKECAKADMRWNDDANVCSEKSGATQAASEATTPRQPLTKGDCDKAGMTWKDNANVCSSDSEASNVAGTQPESKPETNKTGSAVVINIDKTKQKMTVFIDRVEKYRWPVSTGRPEYSTPSGTYTVFL